METFTEPTEDTVITVYANPSFEKFGVNILKYDPNKNNPTIRVKVCFEKDS